MFLGHRRHLRVEVTLPVRLRQDSTGNTWYGKTMNLGAGGLKVKPRAALRPGDPVRLELQLPDGEPEISVSSLTVRSDREGVAFSFVDLEPVAFERITPFVNHVLPRRRLRVLIIEDDRIVAATLSQFIRDEGHETILVDTAEAGLERIERVFPEALILDLSLPGMSGVELLQLLAHRGQRVPAVVIGDAGSEDDLRECLRMGALKALPKPVPLDGLCAMLDVLEEHVINARVASGTLPR